MLTDTEVQAILQDNSKRIEEDVQWQTSSDHQMWLFFKADVMSDSGYPLFVNVTLNREAGKMSIALINRAAGRRIYGLCLGNDHSDPTKGRIGDLHKHKWSEDYADKSAYVPNDITAEIADPVLVWQQFCKEARIKHLGQLAPPPHRQMELP